MNDDPYRKIAEEAEAKMESQRLEQVLDAVEEATVFSPGGSEQLLPVKPMSTAGQKIIDDAVKLCDDIIAAYQEQVDAWTAELASVREFCKRFMAAQEKLAQTVSHKGEKADRLRTMFVKSIDEHDNGAEL